MGSVLRSGFSLMIAASVVASCVVYDTPPPPPSKYDRAWNAALGASQDAGVAITQAEPANGLIRGTRGGIDVTVSVARQVDGSVRVRFDSKGDTRSDPQLPNRFSQAYERRMGR